MVTILRAVGLIRLVASQVLRVMGVVAIVVLSFSGTASADCNVDLLPIEMATDGGVYRATWIQHEASGAKKMIEKRHTFQEFAWACSSVKVVDGPGVYLVFEGAGKLTKLECRQTSKSCKPSPDAESFLSRLLEGVPSRLPGGRRMDENVRIPPGLPTGSIYDLARAGTFDFTGAGTGPWSLVVSPVGGGVPPIQRSGNERTLRLPPGAFQRGGKYSWEIMIGGVRYVGGFDLLGSEEAGEVEQALAEKGIKGKGTTRGQKLDELLVLYDHTLDYEAKLLARELDL